MIYEIDPAHVYIEFTVRHMMVHNVRGRFGKVSGTIDLDEDDLTRSSVEVEIDVASLDTREQQRDAHLLSPDFLDVAKYPVITFKSRRIERHGDGYRVIGNLTIHNVTREVTLDTEFAGLIADPWGNTRAGFSAETSINRRDFGLTWNIALEAGGWLVGDRVKIVLDFESVKKAVAA